MALFALIHGAYHRGSCWNATAAALRAAGHDTVAPDLPIGDPDAGAFEYAQAVLAALPKDASPPVVVGHSLGGLAAAVVPTLTPVAKVVFVAALVPAPGMSFDDAAAADPSVFATYPETVPAIANRDGSASVPLARAVELWYHDAPWNAARDAAAHLRPQHWKPLQEVPPIDALAVVPYASIACTRDRAVNPEWVRKIARERLHVEPIELDAGHCPMISKPAELAAILGSA